jgi:hypothetical protein
MMVVVDLLHSLIAQTADAAGQAVAHGADTATQAAGALAHGASAAEQARAAIHNPLPSNGAGVAANLEFGGRLYGIAVAVISLGFFLQIGEQFLAIRQGQKADWARPFARTAVFFALILFYSPVSTGLITVVKTFGSIDNVAGELATNGTQGVLAARAAEFAKIEESYKQQRSEAAAVDAAARQDTAVGRLMNDLGLPAGVDATMWMDHLFTEIMDKLLWVLTWASFTFAAFAIFALKLISQATTLILLEVGPVMIAFASLPGLTSRYLSAWVMAVVEVTTWGVVTKIILGLLQANEAATRGAAIFEKSNYGELIILNFVYAGMFLMVPSLTHMIFSGAASSAGSSGIAAAMGAATAGARAARAAPGAAAAGGRAVAAGAAGAAKGAKSAYEAGSELAGRVGDAVTRGSATESNSAGIRDAVMQSNAADAASESQRDIHARRGAIEKQRRGD